MRIASLSLSLSTHSLCVRLNSNSLVRRSCWTNSYELICWCGLQFFSLFSVKPFIVATGYAYFLRKYVRLHSINFGVVALTDCSRPACIDNPQERKVFHPFHIFSYSFSLLLKHESTTFYKKYIRIDTVPWGKFFSSQRDLIHGAALREFEM